MTADRELDARIDAEIFGVERKLCTIHHAYSCCGRTTKHYSTQIADAWLVVEKLNNDGYVVEIVNDCVAWNVSFTHVDDGKKHVADWKNSLETQICLAALAVVERRE